MLSLWLADAALVLGMMSLLWLLSPLYGRGCTRRGGPGSTPAAIHVGREGPRHTGIVLCHSETS